jgi:AcrR family transcriptional regulator
MLVYSLIVRSKIKRSFKMARGDTRNEITGAALESLRTRGYARTSARSIAALADVNPGLIFYYFENLEDLLVAAAAEESEKRLGRHRAAVDEATTVGDLIEVLARIYREDLETGFTRVLAEMVSASVGNAELGERVGAIMQPWLDSATDALERVLAGTPLAQLGQPRQAALAAVTFYLGANVMMTLGKGQEEIAELMTAGRDLAALVETGFLPFGSG